MGIAALNPSYGLPRDDKRIEGVNCSGPNHGVDACRYGTLRVDRRVTQQLLRL